MTRILMICGLVLVSFYGKTQTDSTDLNFYSDDLVWENDGDSVLFPTDIYSQFYLEFDLLDTLQTGITNETDTIADILFGRIHIELKEIQSGGIIYKKSYTLSDLQSLNLISKNHITIDFGKLEKAFVYEVSLTVEGNEGSLNPVITKQIIP